MTIPFMRVERLLIWLHWTFLCRRRLDRWTHAIAHRDAWRWWKRVAYACGAPI